MSSSLDKTNNILNMLSDDYEKMMSKFDYKDGKFSLSTKGKLDQMHYTIIREFDKVEASSYSKIKNLTFVMFLTQRFTDSLFVKTLLEKFPQLSKDCITLKDLKDIINDFKVPDMDDIEELFKPDCKINLIHLYLLISKKHDLDIVKQLHFDDNNPFIDFSNILETYIVGCIDNSYLISYCDSEIFKYLYKPEYITDCIKNFYCTVAEADPSIIKLIYTDDDKNKIVSEEEKWTYLHALIWNGSWNKLDSKKKQLECYQNLVTDENKKLKDKEGRTPLDLYKCVYEKIDLSIESTLT